MNNADRSIESIDAAMRRRFQTVTFDFCTEPFRSIVKGVLRSKLVYGTEATGRWRLAGVADRIETFLDDAHDPIGCRTAMSNQRPCLKRKKTD